VISGIEIKGKKGVRRKVLGVGINIGLLSVWLVDNEFFKNSMAKGIYIVSLFAIFYELITFQSSLSHALLVIKPLLLVSGADL